MTFSPSLASLVVLLAWFSDRLLGEPPARLHPVIWMGTYLRAACRRSPPTLIAGVLAWGAGAVVVLLVSGALQWLLSAMASRGLMCGMVASVLCAIALKPLFAWRALRQAGEAVLAAPDLAAARQALGWNFVSRDTSDLSAGEVYGATIESLAENLSDSLVAPLLCFVIGGLPLAALYRYANTADAMWGYHAPELERFGKWAARFDDVLNFIPARLTVLLLLVACPLAGGDARVGWRLWRREALGTASPNAGQPMSTISGALGVQLSKRGYYCLGAEFPEPGGAAVAQALRLCETAAWLAVGGFAGGLLVWGALRTS